MLPALLEMVDELGDGGGLREILQALGKKPSCLLAIPKPRLQRQLLHQDTPSPDLRVEGDHRGLLESLWLLISGEVIGLEKPVASQLQRHAGHQPLRRRRNNLRRKPWLQGYERALS